jgi:hypothetical protein
MNRGGFLMLCLLTGTTAMVVPRSASACAACYGQSDSPMAAGMNWGICSLLVMIVVVLVGVASFFFFLIRRSAVSAASTSAAVAESWMASWPGSASVTRPFEESPQPRAGLMREPTFVRHRKHCAQNRATVAAMAAPRGRS